MAVVDPLDAAVVRVAQQSQNAFCNSEWWPW